MILDDFNWIDNLTILESSDEKKFVLRGVFARAGKPNLNKRIYPIPVMQQALEEIQEDIKQRGFVGTLDHEPTPKVSVKEISHVITKLSLAPDGAVIGEAEALDTVPGKHLQELMKSRIRLGVSTRGTGAVKPYSGPLGEGLVEVLPGYKMRAIDIVFNPSAKAYPQYVIESADEKIWLGSTQKFREVWTNVFGEKF